jgi:MFS family permease
MSQAAAQPRRVSTDIPARLDRLPWSAWHWRVVVALGITWVLDGLEVTIVGTLGARLTEKAGLSLSAVQVGSVASFYVVGAVIGALGFGWLTDKLGRKQLFMVTLGWYTLFTVLSAFSWNYLSFSAFRFLTGMGIGGEYAAINSAIDELIPAYRRGWTDLSINSSWWLGTMLGSALSLLLLDPRLVPAPLGWRLAFGLGAILALAVLLVRRELPESPRWLMTHGRLHEAEAVVRNIEDQVQRSVGRPLPDPSGVRVIIDPDRRVVLSEVIRTMLAKYPTRTILCFTLMVTQAFLYNAIFFTEALVLTRFFHVPSGAVGLYIFPFAIGNLLGPWVLGNLFDSVGRKALISTTYILSGLLLVVTALLFVNGLLSAVSITIWWCVIFFFASAGASSAYLTTSEIFPMEIRAMAIAVVYSAGTLVGGGLAPTLFGALIQTGSPHRVFLGYLLGAGLMIVGGLSELVFGVNAERKSLEDIAVPLTAVDVQRAA